MPARWCRPRWSPPRRKVRACSTPRRCTLDEIVGEMQRAVGEGKEVARVHSGDPSLYGAIAEQIRKLKALGIPYDVTPGRAGLRRGSGGARARAHHPRGEPDGDPDAHGDEILRHAGGRGPRDARAQRRDARHPSLDPQSAGGRAAARAASMAPTARSSSPIASAGRTRRSSTARLPTFAKRCARRRSRGRRWCWSAARWRIRDFRDSALYDAQHVHVLRPKRQGVKTCTPRRSRARRSP